MVAPLLVTVSALAPDTAPVKLTAPLPVEDVYKRQLQEGFPKAQFMVCGVLGPKSNAHGPNEFLHVPYGKKLTAAVAQTMAAMPTA